MSVERIKLKHFGHITRNESMYHLLHISFYREKIPGRRGVGTRTIFSLGNLRNWISKSTTELFSARKAQPQWLSTSKTERDENTIV